LESEASVLEPQPESDARAAAQRAAAAGGRPRLNLVVGGAMPISGFKDGTRRGRWGRQALCDECPRVSFYRPLQGKSANLMGMTVAIGWIAAAFLLGCLVTLSSLLGE
jgi:hypothetical protein